MCLYDEVVWLKLAEYLITFGSVIFLKFIFIYFFICHEEKVKRQIFCTFFRNYDIDESVKMCFKNTNVYFNE